MTCVKNNAILCVRKNVERGKPMNDMIMVYLDYDADNVEEMRGVENEIQYLDQLVEKHGWKYSGMMNVYIPIVKETREETVGKVIDAITSDERLKKYSPKVMCNTLTNVCQLKEIDVLNMTEPRDSKYSRYERYYLENKELVHGIIIDENRKMRDGYISYLLAKEYGCKVDIMEVPNDSPVFKLVIGHHVEYEEEQRTYIAKSDELYSWIYNLEEAVVVGDVLIVQTDKGQAYMQVDKIINTAGKDVINIHKKAISNITALNEITQS